MPLVSRSNVGRLALLTLLAGSAACSSGGTGGGQASGATSSSGAPTRAEQAGAGARTPAATTDKYRDTVTTAALRERAIGELVNEATAGTPEVRVNAIEALSSSPRRVEPILRAALNDPSPAVRITAAVVVGNTKLESSASFVEPLLQDSMLAVRASAAYALQRCGHSADMTPLAELLADPSPRWRAHASYLLGKLGERSALPMLEEAMRGPFPRASGSEMRLMELQISQARVRLGDEEAIHSIRAALFPARSEDLEATALAAQLMGELNDRASTRELVMLTTMKDDTGNVMPPEVRMAAAGSLGALRIGQAAPDAVALEYVKDPQAPLRAQAAFVLGQCGRREHLETLETLLGDQVAQVRVTAAAAIVRMTESGFAASAR